MKVIFKDEVLEELFEAGKTNNHRYKYIGKDEKLLHAYQRAVRSLQDAESIMNIRVLSFLHYEKLKYRAESSIRLLNARVERLLFIEDDDKITVTLIEIDKKHYGNKR